MLPLRDTIPSRNYPVVNNCLIGINIFFYLVELSKGADLNKFIYIYGLVPARYSVPQIASYFSTGQQLFALVSFMFLHGGFWHLLGNMWSLYIFGDNIEDRLGPIRYLLFYLICGITSGLSHLLLNLNSNTPTIGASGAIAGVMGAYLILYPHSKILTLIPIFIIPYFIEIPAFFFLGFWLVLQFLYALGSSGSSSGIAWWAHIGGFIFGIIILKIFLLIPSRGVSNKLQKVTARKKTPRLQIIRPSGSDNDPHLYSSIMITPAEAFTGTGKIVDIPWGFHSRLIKVSVPSNTKEGSLLRLKGMGKKIPGMGRGDLFLKVVVQA